MDFVKKQPERKRSFDSEENENCDDNFSSTKMARSNVNKRDHSFSISFQGAVFHGPVKILSTANEDGGRNVKVEPDLEVEVSASDL